MPDASGPHLSLAVLCERVLQEGDGVPSLIRVVDRITQSAVGPEAPEAMPPVPVALTLALAFKSGAARGRHAIRVRLEPPSGLQQPSEVSFPVLFEGEDKGVNIFSPLNMIAEQEGLYWLDIYVDEAEEPITRVPLRIVYQPLRAGM